MELTKIQFEDGQKVSDAYVEINGVQHPVVKAQYQGKTPLSARNLNKMQDNMETAISDLDERVVSYRNVLVDEQALIKECGGLKLKKLNKLVGKTEQETREGYNLCNAPYTVDNKYTFTASKDDDNRVLGYYATLEAGTEYRVSFETDGSYGFEPGVDTIQMFLVKDKQYDNYFAIQGKSYTFTPTVSGDYYIRVDINKNGATHNFWNFFIRKSTETREFESYGKAPTPDFPSEVKTVTGNVEVKVGNKNLLSIPEFTETKNGITLTYNKGVVTLKGKATETKTVFFSTHKVASVKAGKTYYFDRKVSNSNSNQYATMFLGASVGGFNTEPTFSTYITKKTFDKDGDLILMVYLNNIPSGTDIDLTYKPQLEIGETATDHVEHQSQVFPLTLGSLELCKIGDYADYIYRNGSKWFKRSYIGKYVSTQIETTFKLKGNTIAYKFGTITDSLGGNSFYGLKGYCNISKDNLSSGMYESKNNFGWNIESKEFNIRLDATQFPDLETTQAFFENLPVFLYYVLATPTDTEITDTTLIAQLNALENAQLYEGITNITITGDNLTPIADIDYWTWFKGETGESGNIYSTEEQVIGKWVDGKLLYRKVINVDVISFSEEVTNIKYDCSTLDTVVDLRAMAERQYHVIETIPRIANSTDLNGWYGAIQLDRANHKIIIRLGTTFRERMRNGYSFFVIIEYTKTTDV